MKMQWAWVLPVLTIITLSLSGTVWAQGYPQGYPPGYQAGGAPPGYAPLAYDPNVLMYAPPGTMPGSQPAAYMQPDGVPTPAVPMQGGPPPMMAPGGFEGAPDYAEDFGTDCPYCGGAGCEACGGHHGLLGDVLGIVGPYPDGGCGAVRWYDLAVDYMLLKREGTGRRTDFTSEGIAGPIVLSTRTLDFDEASGFRFSGLFQCGPGSSLEFVYYGLFFWETQATATSNSNNLFSALSNFGTRPFNGFAETDQSDLQSVRYTSKFDNFEVNFRQRWVAPSARYQGSWLAGVRYFKLDEEFSLFSQSTLNSAAADYRVSVFNSLTGLQVGGDIWFCLVPGLRIGGEAKAGVYGNHAGQITNIFATSLANPFQESAKTDDVAFVGDLSLLMTYRLNYNWNLKLGYHFLYVDGVALATETFNPTPPTVFFPLPGVNRTAQINDNGDVFYHGFMAGLEFMW